MYRTSWTKSGDIRVDFWEATNVHPWDLMMEIEYKCQTKYPDYGLIEVKRLLVDDGKRSIWAMIFRKMDGLEGGYAR